MTAPTGPFAAFAAPPRLDPAWNTVTSYDDYAGAKPAVNRLSDDGCPVEHLDIIGSDLRLVERVTGRLAKAHASMAGAARSAWFGLLIGLLLEVFTTGQWFGLPALGAAIGAIWGAVRVRGTRCDARHPLLRLGPRACCEPLRHRGTPRLSRRCPKWSAAGRPAEHRNLRSSIPRRPRTRHG